MSTVDEASEGGGALPLQWSEYVLLFTGRSIAWVRISRNRQTTAIVPGMTELKNLDLFIECGMRGADEKGGVGLWTQTQD